MDGGMLSQDEINALLSGMDLSEDLDSGSAGEDVSGASGSQTESDPPENVDTQGILSDVEKDAIGEVANISMGSSATTLYSLVNRKVNITTPSVELVTWKSLLADYEKPCVFVQIKYTHGLDGTNILVLKENDVKIITDLMMGGDGTNTGDELGELHLSAISEAMNQMMGSAATSLSTMLKETIDISPPDSSLLDLAKFKSGDEIAPFLGGVFVKVAFRMQIGDLVDSTIMQLYPVEFARHLVNTFLKNQTEDTAAIQEQPAAQQQTPAAQAQADPGPTEPPQTGTAPADTGGMQTGTSNADMAPQTGMPQAGMAPQMGAAQMGMAPQMGAAPQMGMPQMGAPQMGMAPQMAMSPQMGMNAMAPQMGMPQMGMPVNQQEQNVNVQPAQFQSFSGDGRGIQGQENIGLIMDVPLEVTVELGRSTKSISEILNFAPGTIIELDRIAGEPIDVLVNGKFVAKGEVVVIEESFGIRVTEIIK